MRRYAGILAVCLGLVLGQAGPALAAWPGQYADVDQWPKWALFGERVDEIEFRAWGGDLAEAVWWELMIGDPPPPGKPFYHLRTFRPQDTITRAEYATILARALGIDTEAAQGVLWYQPAVAALTERGIITAQGSFSVPITRREMGEWVGRSLQWYGVDLSGQPEVDFKDIALLPEAPYIRLAARAGVIKGYPDGTYGPERMATRAEAAAMAVRVAKQLKKNPPDVKVFEEHYRAFWAAITAGEKEVARGKPYDHTYLLKPYATEMLLYGPYGWDVNTKWEYSVRPDDAYRELVSFSMEPVLLRDTIALIKVERQVRRVTLDGNEVGWGGGISYFYYVKRNGAWLCANGEPQSNFPEGWVPQPEGIDP